LRSERYSASLFLLVFLIPLVLLPTGPSFHLDRHQRPAARALENDACTESATRLEMTAAEFARFSIFGQVLDVTSIFCPLKVSIVLWWES